MPITAEEQIMPLTPPIASLRPAASPARRAIAALALVCATAAGLASGGGAARAEDGRFSLTGQIFRPLPDPAAQAPLSFTWDDLAALIRLVPGVPQSGSAEADGDSAAAAPTLGEVLREAQWRKGVFPLVSMSSRAQIEREIGPIPRRSALGGSRSWLSPNPAAGGGL